MTNLIKNWNNKNIRIRSDRYVSLTDMAQATSKRVNNWLRLDSTKSYLKALSRSTQIGATDLVQVIQGGDPQSQGTWGHPKVSIRFAQWCNDEFAVWVDNQIDELMTTGKVSIIAPEPKKAIAYYSDRCADIRKNLVKPKGQWCVIEKCNHLLLEVEKAGYPSSELGIFSDWLEGIYEERHLNKYLQDKYGKLAKV